MSRLRLLAVLAATALLSVTGCSGGAGAEAPLAFGQPAETVGDQGNDLTITPVGVYYHRPTKEGTERPGYRWFVALALKIEAKSDPDGMPPLSGRTLMSVRQVDQVFTHESGNAGSAPWVGRTPGTEVTVHPGSPMVIYYSFDMPQAGGVLEWSTPDDITRWSLPNKSEGPAEVIKPIKDAIADYEGN